MSAELNGATLYVKRDDCTGLAFGRQQDSATRVLPGRSDRKSCGYRLDYRRGAIQLRPFERPRRRRSSDSPVTSSSKLASQTLTTITGAPATCSWTSCSVRRFLTMTRGEDEEGADRRIRERAEQLRQSGRNPYVIPLAPGHPPLGALGYVLAAAEIVDQLSELAKPITTIVVASGSGHTHAGLLFGLRALGCDTEVIGICVRRAAAPQVARIRQHCDDIAALLDIACPVSDTDIQLDDAVLAPGYGAAERRQRSRRSSWQRGVKDWSSTRPTPARAWRAPSAWHARRSLAMGAPSCSFTPVDSRPCSPTNRCLRTRLNSKRTHDEPLPQFAFPVAGDGSGRE